MKPINLNHPEQVKLMNFLIEKTEDVKWQLNIRDLAEEYKQRNGSSKGTSYFSRRIDYLLGKVGKSERIDRATKVKIMFAFGTYVSCELMNELQENAFVEIDEYQRITHYKAYDGSLTLEGEHPLSVKARKRNVRSNESMVRESSKRAAVEMHDDSSKRLRTNHREPRANHPSPGDYESFEHLNQNSESYAPLMDYSGSMEILNHPGEPSNLKIQKLREPKREIEFLKAAGAQGNACTSQIKFLKTIRSLILTLDMPTLSTLQAEIEKKLEDSPDANIPNDVLILAMELMIAKIAHYSVPILSADVESVSLIQLLCYLKALILNSKLKGLEVLMEKIKERIKDPALKDKSIPMENVARALQDTLNNVVF